VVEQQKTKIVFFSVAKRFALAKRLPPSSPFVKSEYQKTRTTKWYSLFFGGDKGYLPRKVAGQRSLYNIEDLI